MQPAPTLSLRESARPAEQPDAPPGWTAATRRLIAGTIRADLSTLPPKRALAPLAVTQRSSIEWLCDDRTALPVDRELAG